MANDSDVLLHLEGISKIYQMGTHKLYALNDIDLEIYRSELIVVLGPSGSGKSTLLNIIGATDRPTHGKLLFQEKDLTQASMRERTLYRRNEIGFIFQFYNLIPTLTALENVAVATAIAKDPLKPEEALELVGLKKFADHFPAQMSGGEQQRVSIARALASNPRILLCDEPTGALDSKGSKKILGLLVDLRRQLHKNIMLITHNTDLQKLGDRAIHLKDGKIENITYEEHPISADELP